MRLLHCSRRGFLGAAVTMAGVVVLPACTTTTVLAPPEQSNVTDFTPEALPFVNAIRARHSLPPLKVNTVTASAAEDQAVRMSSYGKMSHYLGSDRSFFARMKRQGVPMPAAENIAMGQQSVEAAVDAWEHSPKHLENMLGRYDSLGVAVARNAGTGGRPYWAMVLANASSPQPFL